MHTERCQACGTILAAADGCSADPYPTAYHWGDEPYFAEEGWDPLPRCPDCWALEGQAHHFDCIRAHCQQHDDRIAYCPHGPQDPEP
jgi:hypothetical protein